MQISAYTDTGKVRSTNQDYIYASSQKTGPLKNLLLLADGMGGANAGDYASRFLVEKLVTYINRQPEGESECRGDGIFGPFKPGEPGLPGQKELYHTGNRRRRPGGNRLF